MRNPSGLLKRFVGCLVIAILASNCVTAKPKLKRQIALKYSDSVHLDRDQIMVCSYDNTFDVIGCMSPSEYEVRRNAGEFQ